MSAAARLPTAAPAHLPLIAVTTSEMRQNTLDLATDQADPPRQEMVLGMRYLEAVGRAGALAIVVPPMPGPAIPALLERVDGICLSGGPDLHPDAYGAAPHAELGPTEPRLDAFELALARAADERDMPILAICRGMQVLNVARGGTLHQHLPDVVGETVTHRQQGSPSRPTHGVSVAGDSRLAGILGRTERAGQLLPPPGVRRLGERLAVTARAPGRHRRGLRGAGPRLHGRRAVARRVPRGPRRAGGAVQRARRRRASSARSRRPRPPCAAAGSA